MLEEQRALNQLTQQALEANERLSDNIKAQLEAFREMTSLHTARIDGLYREVEVAVKLVLAYGEEVKSLEARVAELESARR